MNTCKVCRKKVRKTITSVVLKKGDLISSRICRECAADGVLLVSDGDKPLVCACGEGPATCCNACASKEARTAVKKAGDMKKHVKHLKGLVKAYTSAVGGKAARIADEHVPGLEMAIDYLESVEALVKD